jgi:hypothetical protein
VRAVCVTIVDACHFNICQYNGRCNNTTYGFTSHAMEYLQEGRALVDIIIIIDINIPVISVSNNNGDMQLRVIRSE